VHCCAYIVCDLKLEVLSFPLSLVFSLYLFNSLFLCVSFSAWKSKILSRFLFRSSFLSLVVPLSFFLSLSLPLAVSHSLSLFLSFFLAHFRLFDPFTRNLPTFCGFLKIESKKFNFQFLIPVGAGLIELDCPVTELVSHHRIRF